MGKELRDCPKCHHHFEQDVTKQFNATIDPSIKDKIISNEIFNFKCPKCGGSLTGYYPFVYADMEREFKLYFANDVEKAKAEIEKDKALHPNFKYRIVNNKNELVEKIYIFEAGLNDRVISSISALLLKNWQEVLIGQKNLKKSKIPEGVKQQLKKLVPLKIQVAPFVRLLLQKSQKGLKPEAMEFGLINNKHANLPIQVPFSDYEMTAAQLKEDNYLDEKKNEYLINGQWAEQVLPETPNPLI